MTISYWCVLVIILFPYLFAALAKISPRYNNHTPREYLEGLTGWRKRAYYVQLNSFEAIPAFGLAVIIAQLAHAYQPELDKLAIAFIIARGLYAVCYIADQAWLRTLCWAAGFFCIIKMFYIAY